MNLPKHISLSIRHNAYATDYKTAKEWLDNETMNAEANGDHDWIRPEDAAAILATGEVWEISWCPDTPVGSCYVVAATFERALELALSR